MDLSARALFPKNPFSRCKSLTARAATTARRHMRLEPRLGACFQMRLLGRHKTVAYCVAPNRRRTSQTSTICSTGDDTPPHDCKGMTDIQVQAPAKVDTVSSHLRSILHACQRWPGCKANTPRQPACDHCMCPCLAICNAKTPDNKHCNTNMLHPRHATKPIPCSLASLVSVEGCWLQEYKGSSLQWMLIHLSMAGKKHKLASRLSQLAMAQSNVFRATTTIASAGSFCSPFGLANVNTDRRHALSIRCPSHQGVCWLMRLADPLCQAKGIEHLGQHHTCTSIQRTLNWRLLPAIGSGMCMITSKNTERARKPFQNFSDLSRSSETFQKIKMWFQGGLP